MKKALQFLLLLLVASLFLLSDAETTSLKPRAFESFNVSYIQNLGSCSYSVFITTSCSSSVYTRDHISLSFGDAYGNQVYVPRLDDPSTRTFERCSSDSFQISGPCAYQICYVYLYRSGPDGWKPETVRISGYNARDVSFYYNTFIPSDIWYGFDLCHSASSSQQQSFRRWFTYAILGFVLCALFGINGAFVGNSRHTSIFLLLIGYYMSIAMMGEFCQVSKKRVFRSYLVSSSSVSKHKEKKKGIVKEFQVSGSRLVASNLSFEPLIE